MDRRAISLLALVAGLFAFAALTLAGMPEGKPALTGRRTKSVTTTRSRCVSRCRDPERTVRSVSISSRPPTPAVEPDLVERAVDNDGGVLVIRFLIAASTALTTAVTLARLFGRRGPGKPPGSESGTESDRDDGSSGGGNPEAKQPDRIEAEPPDATDAEREERDARMHELAVSRQALLKALVSRRPKIRILVGPETGLPESAQAFSHPQRRAES